MSSEKHLQGKKEESQQQKAKPKRTHQAERKLMKAKLKRAKKQYSRVADKGSNKAKRLADIIDKLKQRQILPKSRAEIHEKAAQTPAETPEDLEDMEDIEDGDEDLNETAEVPQELEEAEEDESPETEGQSATTEPVAESSAMAAAS